jgi:hypothetical protein
MRRMQIYLRYVRYMYMAIKLSCRSCIRNAQRYAIITDIASNDPRARGS